MSLRLYLVEDTAIAEVLLLRLGPAAEILDGDEIDLREEFGVLRSDLRVARAVVVARGDLLAFRRVEVLEVFLRHGTRAAAQDYLVDHRHRRFGEDADRRNHDLELVGTQFLGREPRFVFPRDG